jgi:hypothetical protein
MITAINLQTIKGPEIYLFNGKKIRDAVVNAIKRYAKTKKQKHAKL